MKVERSNRSRNPPLRYHEDHQFLTEENKPITKNYDIDDTQIFAMFIAQKKNIRDQMKETFLHRPMDSIKEFLNLVNKERRQMRKN